MRDLPTRVLSVALLQMTVAVAVAQESGKDVQLAPVNAFALPMEIEADSGASNGDATIIRIMPLYNIGLSKDWRVVNLNLITLADAPGGVPGRPGNPNATPGEREFGLSDLIHASFFTPEKQHNYIWGAGFILSMPTATADVLGSGKWAIGPSLRLTYRTGPWNLGAIAGNRWSFAGSSDRAEVNQLLIRGTIRRQLPNDWYFVSAPIITANWGAPSGNRWLVPIGGGFGKVFRLDRKPWAWSLQGYFNVIRPDGAPEWAVRLSVIAAIPYGSDES